MLQGKNYYTLNLSSVIIPGRIIFNHNAYFITKLHKSYHIKKYFVIVDNLQNNIIQDVIIYKCFHPNAWGEEFPDIENPPKYSKFCLPDWLLGHYKFTDNSNYLKLKGEKIFTRKDFENDFLWLWQMDNPHHWLDKEFVDGERKVYKEKTRITITKKLPDHLFGYKK